MATGFARGAANRGKRIAFGNKLKISWSNHSEEVFLNNPNIAPPGSERDSDIEWHPFVRGNRLYHLRDDPVRQKWIWNYNFRAPRGQIFFSEDEDNFGAQHGSGFVLIEPNVMVTKQFARNKQWPVNRYDEVALRLMKEGYDVVQLHYESRHKIPGARVVRTKNFRRALAILKHAALFIGGDGGLHHGAAALAVPAVVVFGAFAPPSVTGYPDHANIAVGEPCGSWSQCGHCVAAMKSISVDWVYSAAKEKLAEHGR